MNFFSQKKFVLLREVKTGKFSTKEQKRAKKEQILFVFWPSPLPFPFLVLQ